MHSPFDVLHDLRYSIRVLRNTPGFSVVAIATIALAIGANTAMFSFVNGVLLRPLPYPNSDRIVRVLERHPTGGLNGISTLNYLDWTKQNAVFEYMAAEVGWRATLTGGGEPIWIRGARVSAHYFDIFGAKPALGRTFRPTDDEEGHDRVVLVSHVLWESRFGSDPAILGRDIVLDGEAHTVIGVLQKDGPFDRATAQIWKPLAFQPSTQILMNSGFIFTLSRVPHAPLAMRVRRRASRPVNCQYRRLLCIHSKMCNASRRPNG